jgi:hypothetical protein
VTCCGWYRAIVLTTPDALNRVQVRIPSITGDASAGLAWPMDVRDPVEKGEGVWVVFEESDMRRPIWVGRWLANG